MKIEEEKEKDVITPVVLNWRVRFKQTSAKASRAKLNASVEKKVVVELRNGGVSDVDRRTAHRMDPTYYVLQAGYEVKHLQSGSLSIRKGKKERFRIHQHENGDYVHCDHRGEVGGDNITLVRTIEPGISYRDAVYRLIGSTSACSPRMTQPEATKVIKGTPKLPRYSNGARFYGRIYLQSRGIDLETIKEAEQQGVINYDIGGILFCGYDSFGNVRAITRRATTPEQERQKTDYAGTNKQYPAILKGESQTVVIVEGGVDVLAVHAHSRRCATSAPTVIAAGGSGVYNFLNQEHIRMILANAEKITIYSENERNAEIQAKTDKQRNDLAARIQRITGKAVEIHTVVEGKDFAEFNQRFWMQHR
jgi:hypothetical protein